MNTPLHMLQGSATKVQCINPFQQAHGISSCTQELARGSAILQLELSRPQSLPIVVLGELIVLVLKREHRRSRTLWQHY